MRNKLYQKTRQIFTSVVQFPHNTWILNILPNLELELSPRWTWKKLRVDDWVKRVLTIVIEDLTTLMINCYPLLYLKEVIDAYLLDTLRTIADKRANNTTEQHHAIIQSKLTWLQLAAHKKRHRTNENCVRNISSRSLDENETYVLSNGLEDSVTPKHITLWYQPTVLHRVLSPFWPVERSYQNRRRTTSGAE